MGYKIAIKSEKPIVVKGTITAKRRDTSVHLGNFTNASMRLDSPNRPVTVVV